ncbi:MAG: hypothetical protein ABSG53_24625, partial [Thermoguttaceae bacterium]
MHGRIIYRHRGGHDEQVAVLPFPERMDHRRHEAQHTTGALEFVKRGPVVVEPIEQLWVDRVGHLDPALVIRLPTLRGEFLLLRSIKLGEGMGDGIAGDELIPTEGLEKTAAHNLKPLVGACRTPRRFD